ncbi:MAG: trypsin-like peptidase domain-containing protein [Ignavibacteria bacterium]|nr:trypsin-like peptidase domain-containing protein [Ignavibacteria bacterium]
MNNHRSLSKSLNIHRIAASLLLFVLLSGYGLAQTSSEVYKKTIASIGMITDRTGAVASGFFVNPKMFVTNHHVTEDLDVKSAKIEMKDDRVYRVKRIVKEFKLCDLAIVEIKDECEDVIELADGVSISRNDEVFSIGNPTDEDMNVDYFHLTKGRINKIDDDSWFYDQDENYTHEAYVIQHTAMIRPGNSGGPLLNRSGQVVGVNTFFYSDSLNYAIHVTELITILDDNNIAYNKSVSEKKITKNEKRRFTVAERFERVFEKQGEIIGEYSYVFVSLGALYFAFIFFGIIMIIVYVIAVKSTKRINYR